MAPYEEELTAIKAAFVESLNLIDARPDPDIARDLVAQLKFELPFSHEKIKSVLKSGWVSPRVSPTEVRSRIERALKRSA
jgi:hypothetical protein